MFSINCWRSSLWKSIVPQSSVAILEEQSARPWVLSLIYTYSPRCPNDREDQYRNVWSLFFKNLPQHVTHATWIRLTEDLEERKNFNVLRSSMVRTSQRENEMIIEAWSITQVGVRPPLLNCKIHNSIHQVGVKRLFLMSDSHYFSVSRTRLYNCASLMPLATGYLLGEVITTVRIAGSNQCLKNRLEQWKLGGSTKRQTMLDLDTLNPPLSILWPPPSANEEIKLRWDWLMVAFCANMFPLLFLQLACHEMQYARTDLREYSDHFHQKSIPAQGSNPCSP